MLNQYDIDILQQQIQNGETPELFYVANMLETREGTIDEAHFKSVPYYKVIKIKISKIDNAYWEVLNFMENPDDYHEESEEEYYDEFTKYIHHYTVPNDNPKQKDFNAKMPSIIYGYRRQVYENDELIADYSDKSPVKVVYTNEIHYGDLVGDDVTEALNNGDLDWKYKKLDNVAKVDIVEDYKYITSNWYILECVNFPRTEHILINTKAKTAYFRDLNDAFNFVKQCEA